MKKTFVLDTNVLLHNPEALFSFEDHKVVIPIEVVEELDKFKKDSDDKGKHARYIGREIDKLRGSGSLKQGVPMKSGGILQILLDYEVEAPKRLAGSVTDNHIILAALSLKQQGEQVIFISKDLNARIKADVLGLEAQDFEKQKIDIDELYKGYAYQEVTRNQIHQLKVSGEIQLSGNFLANQFLILYCNQNPDETAWGRYIVEENKIVLVEDAKPDIWGIKPRNQEQRFACEALLDTKISLVTLVGQAGTGKTLLALAAALMLTLDFHVYQKVSISRPIMPMGKDIGYLPGDKDEKLFFWMQPIFDNLRYIFSEGKRRRPSNKEMDSEIKSLMEQNFLELEALTYIRGRSIPNQCLIIDEAQNLTPHEIKTIISRAGEGTKVILTGDPYQIDNPYLDSNSNGLCYIVDRFKGQSIYAHVIFNKSERSHLASLAAGLL